MNPTCDDCGTPIIKPGYCQFCEMNHHAAAAIVDAPMTEGERDEQLAWESEAEYRDDPEAE